jgi:predicted GIY-YIG superfamily endonuclease
VNAPTALYRFFDAQGLLLYVGITKDLQTRFGSHALTKKTTWWPLVASHSIEWFDNRPSAATAEIRAIQRENPAYNLSLRPSPYLVSEAGGRLISLADLNSYEWFSFGETARRIDSSSSLPSMSRQRLLRLAETDPKWPVHRSQWRYIGSAWLLPWEAVEAYLRGETSSDETFISDQGAPTLDNPDVVTFTTGAELLVSRGVAPRMTNEGVRVASRSDAWPFGEGRRHRYWRLDKVQAMAAEPFLEFFLTRVRKAKSPRPTPKQAFRGEILLQSAQDQFGSVPFTQADVLALGGYSPAAVAKNFKALVSQGRLVSVGTRRYEGIQGKPHILYTTPGSPDQRAGVRIAQVLPRPDKKARKAPSS